MDMDIGEVAHELAVLGVAAARKRVVVVVPLRPGLRQVAEEFVGRGRPSTRSRSGSTATRST